jgi:hypothetical protein
MNAREASREGHPCPVPMRAPQRGMGKQRVDDAAARGRLDPRTHGTTRRRMGGRLDGRPPTSVAASTQRPREHSSCGKMSARRRRVRTTLPAWGASLRPRRAGGLPCSILSVCFSVATYPFPHPCSGCKSLPHQHNLGARSSCSGFRAPCIDAQLCTSTSLSPSRQRKLVAITPCQHRASTTLERDLDVAVVGELQRREEGPPDVVHREPPHRRRKRHRLAGRPRRRLEHAPDHLLAVGVDVEQPPLLLRRQPRLQPGLPAAFFSSSSLFINQRRSGDHGRHSLDNQRRSLTCRRHSSVLQPEPHSSGACVTLARAR